MILVKSIFAGLVAVLGAVALLLSLPSVLHYVVFPILAHIHGHAGLGNRVGVFYFSFSVPHASGVAGIIFLLGFGWEYRRVKAHQAN